MASEIGGEPVEENGTRDRRAGLVRRLRAEADEWRRCFELSEEVRQQEEKAFDLQARTARLDGLRELALVERQHAASLSALAPQIAKLRNSVLEISARRPLAAERNEVVARLAALEETVQSLTSALSRQLGETGRETPQSQAPLLSGASTEFVLLKRDALGAGSKEPEYFQHRLRVFLDFLTQGGEKSEPTLDQITLHDISRFCIALKWMPKHHSVKEEWRNLTEYAALCKNRDANGKFAGRRVETLSLATIENKYIAKLHTFYRRRVDVIRWSIRFCGVR